MPDRWASSPMAARAADTSAAASPAVVDGLDADRVRFPAENAHSLNS